jgi:3-phenylpropionate/cinnamic acid dioxygenase small subunit
VELWELVARESIRDLVARYNANGDSGRFEQMLALFADDGVMELVAADGEVRRFEGVEEIATIFIGTKAGWDDAAAGTQARHHIRHFVATHQIDLVDTTHATGRSYYAVIMEHGLDHWGRYIDDYVERDGRWRIARRRALSDGKTPGGFTE